MAPESIEVIYYLIKSDYKTAHLAGPVAEGEVLMGKGSDDDHQVAQ